MYLTSASILQASHAQRIEPAIRWNSQRGPGRVGRPAARIAHSVSSLHRASAAAVACPPDVSSRPRLRTAAQRVVRRALPALRPRRAVRALRHERAAARGRVALLRVRRAERRPLAVRARRGVLHAPRAAARGARGVRRAARRRRERRRAGGGAGGGVAAGRRRRRRSGGGRRAGGPRRLAGDGRGGDDARGGHRRLRADAYARAARRRGVARRLRRRLREAPAQELHDERQPEEGVPQARRPRVLRPLRPRRRRRLRHPRRDRRAPRADA